jgi:hypothetical protein
VEDVFERAGRDRTSAVIYALAERVNTAAGGIHREIGG